MDANKWWLISDKDVKIIRDFLRVITKDPVAGIASEARYVLHTLDSGLNTTDEVPDDFKVEDDPTLKYAPYDADRLGRTKS